MSDLKELVKQRGSIKSRLTLFANYVEPLTKIDLTQCTKLQTKELTLRLGKLQDLFYNFDEVQIKIEELDPDSEKQLKERQDLENRFYTLIAQAQELIENWTLFIDKPNDVSSRSSCGALTNIKLPPLKIPPFDGNVNNWIEFRDTYISLIHNNEKIDCINKFHYLKSYLEGTASILVNSISVSADNYNIAWSLLCERFNNKRILINQHLKCLFSIEPLSKESDKGLRNLIDTITKNLSALNSLGEPTKNWDTLIIYMASAKLDTVTARNWEEYRSTIDLPTLDDFYTFLRNRATVLETVQSGRSDKTEPRHQQIQRAKSFIASSSDISVGNRCVCCKQTHKLYDCSMFKSLSIEERNRKVCQWRLCSNCLRGGHQPYQCRLSGCRICRGKHNTLLHRHSTQNSFSRYIQQQSQNQTQKQQHIQQQQQHIQEQQQYQTQQHQQQQKSRPTELPGQSIQQQQIPVEASTSLHAKTNTVSHKNSSIPSASSIIMSAVSSSQALLSTALVEVTNNGKSYILRALLDSGSQSSFISAAAQKKIDAYKLKNNYQTVSGLGNTIVTITEHCKLDIKSLHNSFTINVKCYILPLITDSLPHAEVQFHELGIPSNIELADPRFYHPSDIDLLLGADIFWELIKTNRMKLGPNKPVLQDTYLGWIVGGPIGDYSTSNMKCHFSQDIREQLTRFWELEELPTHKVESVEDNYCEKLFIETTHRESNGRFCVQIPLKESPDVLGDSYKLAEKRLLHQEKRLQNRPEIYEDYRRFMREYEHLGHLSVVERPDFGCYLPHHAVIKENSETTKLRVVFDGSAKTSSGKSFNDIQYVGPVVQDDLFSILLRFRQHRYVVSADVEKMYRQILVKENQRHLQLILWREHNSQPIKIFQLNTVTYGTASAPYLSTRCLLQLSNECSDENIAKLIKEDFYVDDYFSGAETIADLRHNIKSVTEVLNSACLPLRKFRTNVPLVFDNIGTQIPQNLDITAQSSALGLKWDPKLDVLEFPAQLNVDKCITKRTILSNSAKLFDPLGLLSPCTIIPKIILQKLWLIKSDWDDAVDTDLKKQWLNFVMDLNILSNLRIPRCVIINNHVEIELHSFSDASQDAYAACVYLRSMDAEGRVLVKLLCAKTKVAPIKATSIPRLELCGALLSARLSSKVEKSLRCSISKKIHWTDSSVVLSWLSCPSRNLKTFVANRIGEIQELTSSSTWRHVPGSLNPADLASRGIDPQQLTMSTLWWQGPSFLQHDASDWPANSNSLTEIPEMKTYSKTKSTPILSHSKTLTCTNSKLSHASKVNTYSDINPQFINFEKYSRFTTLQRVMAYILRFIHNIKHASLKITGYLNTEELGRSLTYLIKLHQNECFTNELKLLGSNKNLPLKSRILSLNPFIDGEGLLRVGGRIQNAPVVYSKKHPVLLDSGHNFTKLLFVHEHTKLLHGGPQLLLASIRDRFWPIRGRILAKTTVNNCRICRILKAETINPIMGNLPASRVTPTYPFQVSGVDFAGPFQITDRKGRGCRISKCYLCLFVCFATKALHLEVASDLSTDNFISCLRRFISRRGKPSEIYSDNGTNFVGANNELRHFIRSCNEDISSFASGEGIKFLFSPAYSPHFGGLWEASVKSAKFHMLRILGNKHLTFEELSTLFTQIEAILNSRPLTPLSSDPNDFEPLTPGHFLIGRALTSLPSPMLTEVNPNRLNRYQHMEQMRQHFWQRWHNEYLSELQQRVKWRINREGLQEGDVVLIKDSNLPPLKWRMGRICKLYPGPDGVTRVADVTTVKGIARRAVNKLCYLPTDDSSRTPKVFEGGEHVRK